jgi:two-component system, cell cycle sensor histidine kinase and response regulator CckA
MDTHGITIPTELLERWRDAVNLLADVIKVPSVLLTIVESKKIHVVAYNEAPDNPFRAGEEASIAVVRCCESVLSAHGNVLVADARIDARSSIAPGTEPAIESCFGLPVRWPNGHIFGILCVIGISKTGLDGPNERVLTYFRDTWERDLAALYKTLTTSRENDQLHLAQALDERTAELIGTKEWFERLFEDSPFPFWEMDLSDVKKYLDGVRANGFDPCDYLETHPEAYQQCARRTRHVRFNKATLRLNDAKSERELYAWLAGEMMNRSGIHIKNFSALIRQLAAGRTEFEMENLSVTVTGRMVHCLSRVVVSAGCEETWSRVLVSTLDLTERKRAEQATAHLATIVESSDDSIIGTDLESKIISWNRGAQMLYGYTAEEAVGQPVSMIVPPDKHDLRSINRRLAKGESIRQFETSRIAKDGSLKEVSITISPIMDSSGAIIGACGIGRDITERKRADDELRESMERYEALFDQTPISLYEIDLSGVKHVIDRLRESGITDFDTYFRSHPEVVLECGRQFKMGRVNKTTLELRGAGSAAELRKWVAENLADPSSVPFRTFADNIIAFASGSTVYENEVLTPTVSGKWMSVLGRVTIMPGFEDSWSRVLVSGIDLTELRGAEAARAYLSYIVESTDDAIFGNTLDGLVTSWNEGAERLYGYSAEEVLGRHVSFLFPDDRQDDMNRIMTSLEAGPGVEQRETVHLTKSGRRLDVSITVSRIRDSKGVAIGSSIIARNITKRKQAEDALRQSQQEYSNLVNSIDGIVWQADAETFTFSFVSSHAERILGYSAESWLNDPGFWIEHIHHGDRERVIELSRKAITERRDYEFQYRMLHAGGRIVWLHDFVTVVADGSGPVELRGVMVDITEQKKAEKALRKSEEQHRLFFELDLAANYISTPSGALKNCNPVFARMFGFDSVQEAIETGVLSLHPNPEAHDAFVEMIRTHARVEYLEEDLYRKDGSVVHAIESAIGTFDENGALVEIRGYLMDDTERRKIEQQLQQSQRLEAVGRLAGGIAHDFNNLLTIIMGYSQLLLRRIPKSDRNYADVFEIVGASERAGSLTNQLLAFSRNQILQPRVIDLNHVVADLDRMLRRVIGEHIDLVTVADPRVGRVKADPGQIEQVVVNLAVNARDAMPNGGRLTIETANAYLDENYTASHIGAAPGHHVMLAVSDNGAGIDEEVQSHIFEPFFTTKQASKGTGLGLSTVYGIVKQSGGNIWVYSEPGRGTTFKVYLPRVDEAADARTHADQDEVECRGTETVLLVEDETAVRQLAARALREAGFTVIEASGADEALRLIEPGLEAGTPQIQMLVTDVVMPGMGGKELADRIVAAHPSIKALFITGYTDNAIVHNGHLGPGIDILQKPFRPRDLARKVREVLDAAR